ncbi:MAG: YggT family protein [Miltoncostaeaceae bacterium]|jgi:YggT family protein|nr:YggT family protein [Miltoncostaeaceae bacterium]
MDTAVSYVDAIFTVYVLVLLIRILLSWVPMAPVRPFWRAVVQFFYDSTDWYLRFFRRIIPPVGPLDLSPIVALIVLYIVRVLLINLLQSF